MARRALFALAGAGCAAYIVGAPVFYAWPGGKISSLQIAGVWVASAASIRVTSPIMLSKSPRLVLMQGTLHNQAGNRDVVRGGDGRTTYVPKLRLDRPSFVLHTVGRAKTAAAADPLQDLAQALATRGFESLAIRDGTLQLRGTAGRSVTLRGITAQFWGGRQRSGLAGKGTFILNRELISFDLVTQRQRKISGTERLPAQLILKSKNLYIRFSGHLTALNGLQLAGKIDLQVSNLRSLARMFNLDFPYGGGLRNFAANGQLSWQGDTLSFNKSTFVMDGNSASGALNLNIARPRPSIEGTLALRSLNLKRYIQPSQSKIKAEFLTRFLPKQSSSSLNLLRYFDADLRLSADKILLAGFTTGRGAAAVTLKSGKLLADIAEIDLGDGSGVARGQFTIDMTDAIPAYVLRGKIADTKVGRLLAGVPGARLLPDRATLTFDLAARGSVAGQIMSTMSGKASVIMNAEARIGVDLRPLLAASQAKQHPDWLGKLKGQMPVKRGVVKFVVGNGMVQTELLSCASGDYRFSGNGTMDLATRLVDFRLAVRRQMSAAPRGGGKGPPVVLHRSVRIHGLWQRPALEVGAMTRTTAPAKRTPQPGAAPPPPVRQADRC